jgi:hypothetical protein
LEILTNHIKHGTKGTQNPYGYVSMSLNSTQKRRASSPTEESNTNHKTPRLDDEPHRGEDIAASSNHCPSVSYPSGADQYVVLGSLILSRPPEEYRQLAEFWEPELQKLNSRNMKGKDLAR